MLTSFIQAFCEASKRTMAWFLLRLSTKTGVLISDNSYDQQTVPGNFHALSAGLLVHLMFGYCFEFFDIF